MEIRTKMPRKRRISMAFRRDRVRFRGSGSARLIVFKMSSSFSQGIRQRAIAPAR
jgi:hypothetical protein